MSMKHFTHTDVQTTSPFAKSTSRSLFRSSTIKTVLIACACYLAAAAFSLPASAKEAALTNKGVERMVQASLPESLILEKIRASKKNFNTSVEGLVDLKKAGVSDTLIREMINPGSAMSGGTSKSSNTGARVAVASLANGSGQQVAECATSPQSGQMSWLSGASPAMWYSRATGDETTEFIYEKGTVRNISFPFGHVELLELSPKQSNLRLPNNPVFFSCINPADAPLVKFSLDKDVRNTSLGRGSVFNFSTGISKDDLVPFVSEKMPDGRYKISFNSPLNPGEYGFVPQSYTGFFAMGERVYTFGVD
ncbi:MAG: hypothetical protein ACYCTY_12920 [Sulfuricella sp.]